MYNSQYFLFLIQCSYGKILQLLMQQKMGFPGKSCGKGQDLSPPKYVYVWENEICINMYTINV